MKYEVLSLASKTDIFDLNNDRVSKSNGKKISPSKNRSNSVIPSKSNFSSYTPTIAATQRIG